MNRDELKKRSKVPILHMVLVVFLISIASISQADWEPRLQVTIPFQFSVDNSTLPAGEYVFSTSPAEANALRIYRIDGDAGVLTLTQEIADSEVPAETIPGVVFETLNGKHFLEQIHIPSAGWHWEVDKGDEYLDLKAGGKEGERETISPGRSS